MGSEMCIRDRSREFQILWLGARVKRPLAAISKSGEFLNLWLSANRASVVPDFVFLPEGFAVAGV